MNGLVDARRRYSALLEQLQPESGIDRDLHAELMRAIQALDDKMAAGGDPAVTPCGQSAAAPAPARRRRTGR